MSPRRNRPKRKGSGGPKPEDEGTMGSFGSLEEQQEGMYMVRKVTGSASTKPYRCPGCDQLIPTATPHIVAWLEEDLEGRRHWHSACWAKKDHRKPRVERTRNAPKY